MQIKFDITHHALLSSYLSTRVKFEPLPYVLKCHLEKRLFKMNHFPKVNEFKAISSCMIAFKSFFINIIVFYSIYYYILDYIIKDMIVWDWGQDYRQHVSVIFFKTLNQRRAIHKKQWNPKRVMNHSTCLRCPQMTSLASPEWTLSATINTVMQLVIKFVYGVTAKPRNKLENTIKSKRLSRQC